MEHSTTQMFNSGLFDNLSLVFIFELVSLIILMLTSYIRCCNFFDKEILVKKQSSLGQWGC